MIEGETEFLPFKTRFLSYFHHRTWLRNKALRNIVKIIARYQGYK
jgi:hypothetical protein